MAELIALLNEISTPVKLLWAVWLIWAVVQTVWYRRGRVIPPQPPRSVPSYGSGQRRSAPVSNQPLRSDVAKLHEAVAQRKVSRDAGSNATARPAGQNATGAAAVEPAPAASPQSPEAVVVP
jgi:hypothetical protein